MVALQQPIDEQNWALYVLCYLFGRSGNPKKLQPIQPANSFATQRARYLRSAEELPICRASSRRILDAC